MTTGSKAQLLRLKTHAARLGILLFLLPLGLAVPKGHFWLPQVKLPCSQGGQDIAFCKEGFCPSPPILDQAWCSWGCGSSILKETALPILGVEVQGHEVGNNKKYWSALPGGGNREQVPVEGHGILPGGAPPSFMS